MSELTENQVWSVLQFAKAMNDKNVYGMGVYTPDMLNSTLKNLNVNPQVATPQKINKALGNYKSSEKELQSMNEFMEYTDMLYKKVINYYTNLLAFDLSISCKNAYTKQDYSSAEYKADKKIIHKFLDKFKYESEFRKMTKEMLRRETVFTWYREDTDGATLQTMPQEYCKLTGYFPQGLLYNFDMSYFLQAGVDIDNYPPVFKDYYNEVFDGQEVPYIQSKNLKSMDNTFALWTEVSPYKGAWAFKMDTSNFISVPFFSAMMQDSIFSSTIRALQRDKRMLEAYMLILGEMPLLNETKTQKVDSFAIDPTTMGQLLSIVRSSIDEHYKIGAVPAVDLQGFQYEDKNPEVYNNQLNTVASTGVSASRIIYSSDRMSQEELRQALMTDYLIMKPLYSQFENFLEFFINQKTRKYKFRFEFDGSTLLFERKDRIDRYMKLAENGIVLKGALISAHGIKPQSWDSQILEAEADGLKFESIHTASSKDSDVGKPTNESKNENVGEAGEKTQNAK